MIRLLIKYKIDFKIIVCILKLFRKISYINKTVIEN